MIQSFYDIKRFSFYSVVAEAGSDTMGDEKVLAATHSP